MTKLITSSRRNYIKYYLFLFIYITFNKAATSQNYNTWIQKSSLPAGTRATSFAFSIGNKGYIGGGLNFTTGAFQDFWEYDPITDSWTQKANYGGGKRSAAVAFSIGGKGYALTGADQNAVKKTDIWEYDPALNTWTQKTNLPSTARNYAVAFAIGNKGYLGTGYTSTGFVSLNDFWQFDPALNIWTQKANVPGPQRSSATGFAIGGKGYIGIGDTCNNNACFPLDDFYAYDTTTNTWSQMANAGTSLRNDAVSFVINGRGFICTGEVNFSNTNDLIEYDPATNSWTTRTSKPGLPKTNAFAFSAGNRGYVGTGYDNSFNTTNDLYEYTPDSSIFPTSVNEISYSSEVSIIPNPLVDKGSIIINSSNKFHNVILEIYSLNGKKITNFFIERDAAVTNENVFHFNINNLQPGVYFYSVRTKENVLANGKIVVIKN